MAAIAEFRRATPADYPSIVRLNEANFIDNLPEAQRKSGFLSALFSLEQTARIAEDLGTMVALVNDRVAGFLCAFRNDFESGSPVIAEMLRSYDKLTFEERPLGAFNGYIYGPVCIAREYRGQSLLRGLYEAQKRDLAGRFEIGVAFVSRANPHSLSAHVSGLGMSEAGEFAVKNNVYVALAFRVPRKADDVSAF